MDKLLASYYKKEEWKEFRLKILDADNYTCAKCHRVFKDKTYRLHVHHKTYFPDTKPWEYNLENVTTYCSSCHLEEHGKAEDYWNDWEYVGFEDLGEVIGDCEFPGCQHKIRYQHILFHPHYGEIYVGAKHADVLLRNSEASDLEKTIIRRNNFCQKFKQSDSNLLTATWLGYTIEIKKKEDYYYATIGNFRSETHFESLEKAQYFSFDIINRGLIENSILEQNNTLYNDFISLNEWSILEHEYKIEFSFLGHHCEVLKKYRKKLIYENQYYAPTEESIEFFDVKIDSFQFESYNTAQEVQMRLFDLLYDKKNFAKEFKKACKSVKKKITDIYHWDREESLRIYRQGKFIFEIEYNEDRSISLFVKHKDYTFENFKLGLNEHLFDYYFVNLGTYSSFDNASNAAYDYLVHQDTLMNIINTDKTIHYLCKSNWQISTNSTGLLVHSYILNEIKIEIIRQKNDKYIANVSGLPPGHIEFETFEEVQHIVFDYIQSGKYRDRVGQ